MRLKSKTLAPQVPFRRLLTWNGPFSPSCSEQLVPPAVTEEVGTNDRVAPCKAICGKGWRHLGVEGRGGEGDVARPSDRLLTVGGAIIRGLPYSSSLRLQAKVDFSYVKELGFFCWYYRILPSLLMPIAHFRGRFRGTCTCYFWPVAICVNIKLLRRTYEQL